MSTQPTTVELCLQQLWSDAKVKHKAVVIFEHFYLKPGYLDRGASAAESERSNRISGANFYRVFHSNYGSNLLSFRDMTTGRTTDGRRDRRIDVDKHCIALYGGQL